MKKHFLLLIALFAASMFVMAEMTIYVYKKDGTKVPYSAATVDSVGFVDINHEYVDLGLSVMWATCNVGANSPEEYGDYFAWGEMQSKDVYDWDSYKWYNECTSKITKYGEVDNKTILDTSDDIAYVFRGENVRMPTKSECEELLENCVWKFESRNNINGYTVTSNINGKSIFLPLSGYYYNNKLNAVGQSGFFWSSSLYVNEELAYHLDCKYDDVIIDAYNRCIGFSIRPVLTNKKYIVSFDANGAEGIMEDIVVPFQETIILPKRTFTYSHAIFKGWNTKSDGTGESYSDEGEYFPISTDITLYAQWELDVVTGSENNYKYVDMGLSVKWATCNIGAYTRDENGSYYAYGEISTKKEYTSDNHVYSGGSNSLTKSNDAASVNWGGNWRMPTLAEIEELLDTSNCRWEWITRNGQNGYKVTSMINGNSIFLPAAGYKSSGSLWDGIEGHYSSSSYSCCLSFHSKSHYSSNFRGTGWSGYSIRPVLP